MSRLLPTSDEHIGHSLFRPGGILNPGLETKLLMDSDAMDLAQLIAIALVVVQMHAPHFLTSASFFHSSSSYSFFPAKNLHDEHSLPSPFFGGNQLNGGRVGPFVGRLGRGGLGRPRRSALSCGVSERGQKESNDQVPEFGS